MTARTPTPPRRTASVRAISPSAELDSYLRTIAGRAPGARLLEIRFALRHRDMGRVFLAAHSAPGAARFIRRLAARTDVYVGVALRTRAAGGRDAIDPSDLATLVRAGLDEAVSERKHERPRLFDLVISDG